MMLLSPELFLTSIEEQKVYYFSSNQINSDEPHYFVCIKTENGFISFSCCTSQKGTIDRFLKYTPKVSESTIVWIDKKDTLFKKETYINCNSDPIVYSEKELKEMYSNEEIEFKGELSDSHYNQILVGIHESPMVTDEFKETLTQPE